MSLALAAGVALAALAAALGLRAGRWLVAQDLPRSVSALPLAWFRIVYSLVLIGEVSQLVHYQALVADPVPFLVPSELHLAYALAAWQLALGCLLIGLATRVAAIVNYVMTLATLSTFVDFEYHVDYLVTCVNLLLMFAPVGARLSLDRLLESLRRSRPGCDVIPPGAVSALHPRLLLLFGIAAVYTDSVLYKLVSPMWLGGLGVWLPASLPQIAWHDLTPLLDREWLVRGLGYLTLGFEAAFVFLIWFRRLHPALLVVGLGLHLGIVAAFPIPWFGLAVVSLYALLVPPEWYALAHRCVVRRSPALTLRVGDGSASQQRLRLAIAHFDVRRAVAFELRAGRSEPIALDADGREIARGTEAWRLAAGRVTLLAPVAFVLRFAALHAPARSLARSLLRAVGSGRLQASLAPRAAPGLLVALIAFLVASQLVASAQAPLVQVAAARVRLGGLHAQLAAWARTYTARVSRPLAGITGHGVFMDAHFRGYERIISLAHVDASGRETWLPLYDAAGSPTRRNTGRLWVFWSWRVVGPRPDPVRLADGIERVTAFWAHEAGVPLDDARFVVRSKHIGVPVAWEPGFLRRQASQPWTDVGTAGWRGGRFWIDIESL